DLRTPLARMRLEIEMSQMTDEARQAIDEDLAQINHSIEQLMEYARPAGSAPDEGTDITQVVEEIYERERPHTETLGGTLSAQIQNNLWAKIAAHDLKRIVINWFKKGAGNAVAPVIILPKYICLDNQILSK